MSTPPPTIGAVVLTMNDRKEEFTRAMDSLLAQEGVDLDVVVVGNGVEPELVPPGVRTVALPENVGIPGGRNVGAERVKGDLLLFFDNDAILPEPDSIARLAARLQQDPSLAYVQPRIADPDTGVTLRRWVPRLRADATRPGTVTVMAEGIMLMRREAFERVGGWPGHFFLFHEGIDLAWRCWDHGYTGYYLPDVTVHHPATNPARHAMFYRMNARNRVWLARRNLPRVLVPVNLAVWTLLTLWRFRDLKVLRTSLAGFREGVRTNCGTRTPMSWRTVARLTLAGRPPVF
ncbi:glycosyltransferase family 2 protein [Streptomyces netropsis]|uniref:GT2 family glycosyltransferase n=1 Tax=Streptomyces netropsis TaxID=55404 RepID=A0A7W7LDB1_STRNE|nr:glycosyltransferase family 2 protein [Streptomyces netropsis]MBB4888113.1 GT2 family glycosyltransferase [Streptomyces netropsis]GGR31945.1 glycosyl transferase [Streptomyces netropsis]